jgi:hypothetical protein
MWGGGEGGGDFIAEELFKHEVVRSLFLADLDRGRMRFPVLHFLFYLSSLTFVPHRMFCTLLAGPTTDGGDKRNATFFVMFAKA